MVVIFIFFIILIIKIVIILYIIKYFVIIIFDSLKAITIHVDWNTDENPIIFFVEVWFIPVIAGMNIEGSIIINIIILFQQFSNINGASFCQVNIIIEVLNVIALFTLIIHVCKGGRPSFTNIAIINIVLFIVFMFIIRDIIITKEEAD